MFSTMSASLAFDFDDVVWTIADLKYKTPKTILRSLFYPRNTSVSLRLGVRRRLIRGHFFYRLRTYMNVKYGKLNIKSHPLRKLYQEKKKWTCFSNKVAILLLLFILSHTLLGSMQKDYILQLWHEIRTNQKYKKQKHSNNIECNARELTINVVSFHLRVCCCCCCFPLSSKYMTKF